MSAQQVVKVCYILSYYSPNYTRTKSLLAGLNKIDGVLLYEARNSSTGLSRYIETIAKLIWIRIMHRPQIFVLGFRGYEIYWPIRLLTLGRALYFDHMMSPYDSLVSETKKLKPGSLVARFVYLYERLTLKNASLVLTDTSLHHCYLTETFNLSPEKVVAVHLGANEELFYPRKERSSDSERDPFTVLFYGSFLPLHGVELILQAARTLKDKPIRFLMFGGARMDLTDFKSKLKEWELDNIHHEDWIEQHKLPELIGQVDLCLGGPFGDTGQARRVITNKTFECLATGTATVIGHLEVDYGFRDKQNCLLVRQGDAQSLAAAIRWAYENRDCLPEIGREGNRLFHEQFSSESVAEALSRFVQL